MNPHQRCLQAKVKYWNDPKQVMPKSEDLSKSQEIKPIWTFDTDFLSFFNKSCMNELIWCASGPIIKIWSATDLGLLCIFLKLMQLWYRGYELSL